jgi:hypothetical protein
MEGGCDGKVLRCGAGDRDRHQQSLLLSGQAQVPHTVL